MEEIDYRDKVSDVSVNIDAYTKSLIYKAAKEITELVASLRLSDYTQFRISDNEIIKQKVLDVISKLKIDISENLRKAISENILSIANIKNKDLYDLDEYDDYDPENVMSEEIKGLTFYKRLDTYADRFIYDFESYIVVGLTNKMPIQKIVDNIALNLHQPYKSTTLIRGSIEECELQSH